MERRDVVEPEASSFAPRRNSTNFPTATGTRIDDHQRQRDRRRDRHHAGRRLRGRDHVDGRRLDHRAPGRPSSLHHLSPNVALFPAVDEPLEPFVVVHERMRHRVEPFHGVLRPVEPHFDPAALDRHPSGRFASLLLKLSAGTLNRIPVRPGLPELGEQALAPLLLVAERRPAAVLLGLLQELGPPGASAGLPTSSAPRGLHEGGGAHLADAEEPLDVAAREEGPIELLELAVASGMARSHRGCAGTVEVLSARGPPGRRRGRVRAGGGGRDADPPADAPVPRLGRLSVRLEAPGRLEGLLLDAGGARGRRGGSTS